MARWLLHLHDHVADDGLPFTQDALAQLLGVRRTTVTLTMNNLRARGAIKYERRGLVTIYEGELSAAQHLTVPHALVRAFADHVAAYPAAVK
jgi:Mn-dependent DtxR family transcriptional regulator